MGRQPGRVDSMIVAPSAATPRTSTTRNPARTPASSTAATATGSRTSPSGPKTRVPAAVAVGPCRQMSTIGTSTATMTAMTASRHTPAVPVPPSPATNVPRSACPAGPDGAALTKRRLTPAAIPA